MALLASLAATPAFTAAGVAVRLQLTLQNTGGADVKVQQLDASMPPGTSYQSNTAGLLPATVPAGGKAVLAWGAVFHGPQRPGSAQVPHTLSVTAYVDDGSVVTVQAPTVDVVAPGDPTPIVGQSHFGSEFNSGLVAAI